MLLEQTYKQKNKEAVTLKNPIVTTENGIRENMTVLFDRRFCNVIKIKDATEDSVTGAELLENLNNLKLFSKFTLDRETQEYARLITVDCWGNTHYFKAWK